MGDVASVLMGNPWPLVKTAGTVLGIRQISKLLADPEFLKLTEEIILANNKNNTEQLISSFYRAAPFLLSQQYSQDTNPE